MRDHHRSSRLGRGPAVAALVATLVLQACAPVTRTPTPATSPASEAPASPTLPSSPSSPPPSSPPPSVATETPLPSPTPSADPAVVAKLIGQKLAIRMDGTAPTEALLARIRAGEVSGIVLYRDNFVDAAGLQALTATLQLAARAGGQPPLLLMTDQEGGDIRNLAWAPPEPDARAMGASESTDDVEELGRQTGAALAAVGINVDLAPVADVPRSDRSFMYLQRRTFSFDPEMTASLATAFANGLRASGVVPTVKHFPGIGRVRRNTDFFVGSVPASLNALQADLRPFRRVIEQADPIVMLSNAAYEAIDPDNAAGWSPAVATALLRDELGFTGVSITDSLTGTAQARNVSERSLALQAAIAGTDMIMLTGPEASSRRVFDHLVAKAEDGAIPLETLQSSYDRILELKATLP